MSDEPEKVEVTVKKEGNDEEKAKLKQQLEEKTTEAEDFKSKLEIVAQKEFERKKRELNCDDETITTPEQLKAWESGRKGKTGEAGAGGVVPLPSSSDEGFEWLKKEYDSPVEMVRDLRKMAREGSDEERENAKKVLDAMFLKALKSPNQSGSSEGIGLKELRKPRKKKGD